MAFNRAFNEWMCIMATFAKLQLPWIRRKIKCDDTMRASNSRGKFNHKSNRTFNIKGVCARVYINNFHGSWCTIFELANEEPSRIDDNVRTVNIRASHLCVIKPTLQC